VNYPFKSYLVCRGIKLKHSHAQALNAAMDEGEKMHW